MEKIERGFKSEVTEDRILTISHGCRCVCDEEDKRKFSSYWFRFQVAY